MSEGGFKILYEFVSITFKDYFNAEGQDASDGIHTLRMEYTIQGKIKIA